MEADDLKKEVSEIFKSKTGATSIVENKKVQAMADSIIEAIAPYLEKPYNPYEDVMKEKDTKERSGFFSRFFN
jgi:hypothetical protein